MQTVFKTAPLFLRAHQTFYGSFFQGRVLLTPQLLKSGKTLVLPLLYVTKLICYLINRFQRLTLFKPTFRRQM